MFCIMVAPGCAHQHILSKIHTKKTSCSCSHGLWRCTRSVNDVATTKCGLGQSVLFHVYIHTSKMASKEQRGLRSTVPNIRKIVSPWRLSAPWTCGDRLVFLNTQWSGTSSRTSPYIRDLDFSMCELKLSTHWSAYSWIPRITQTHQNASRIDPTKIV